MEQGNVKLSFREKLGYGFGDASAALSFYGISKKLNLQIQDELAERRKVFTLS